MGRFDYEDIPLPSSVFGARAYRAGRGVIAETNLTLDKIMWDADEILWDWVMDASEIFSHFPQAVFFQDIGHREFYLAKPGVFELIWGMHHESLDRDLDPHMRIWTDGYPWRVWKIAQQIPGFMELVGHPDHYNPPLSRDEFADHPRIFFRTDYVKTAIQLFVKDNLSMFLKNLAPSVYGAVQRQLERNPVDPSFKLPEFAEIRGKPGFKEAEILIDDYRDNVYRFVSAGRKGVHAISHTPKIGFDFVPNTVWSEPKSALYSLAAKSSALNIASALRSLARTRAPATRIANPAELTTEYKPIFFTLDIPDRILRSEWIEPVQNLKRRLQN